MRLLYGVQATGNGHISRARALQHALADFDVQVDFLFSGRPAAQLFDMQQFGDFQWRQGLSFVSRAGAINHWQTFLQADLRRLSQDIRQLETRRYDLVLTDFEPVTAWAARRQGTPLIALGHQYALTAPTPLQGMNLLQRSLLNYFAPARINLGLHWHHFEHPQQQGRLVLPPIIDFAGQEQTSDSEGPVLVYLPFEAAADVLNWLTPLRQYQFRIYGAGQPTHDQPHLQFCPPSVQGFKQDLIRASAVISNAGFELISEALQLQKRILVKPLAGQPEQASNALALQQLQVAAAQTQLSSTLIADFLTGYVPQQQVSYPNVAHAIAHWLVRGDWYQEEPLTALWQQTRFSQAPDRMKVEETARNRALDLVERPATRPQRVAG
jgi:uncharacterized protein (TIGR00661 family)